MMKSLDKPQFLPLFSLLLFLIVHQSAAEDQLYNPPPSVPEEVAEELSPEEVSEKPEIIEKDERSTSDQISVVGGDLKMRGGILSIAGKMNTELFELTGKFYEKPKLPIIIQLIGKQGDKPLPRSMVTTVEKVEGVYQMKLFIHLANSIDNDLLQYYLMELFLYERGLSAGQQVSDGERILVKPWLITGLLESIKIKRGNEDKDLYQAEVDYFSVLSVEEVFSASEQELREMFGLQPMAFQAISGSLVNALLRQVDGDKLMNAYIRDFATFKGESENLMQKHFPGVNQSTTSLEKLVGLEMLELSTAETTQAYSIVETDDRLENYLKLRYKDEEDVTHSVAIYDYSKIMELEERERANAVATSSLELKRLSYRCFPAYRPLIYEYLSILGEIARGKGKNIDGRLAKLSDSRSKMVSVAKHTTDYLNWFYITQSNQVGGDFKQYREISDKLTEEASRAPADDHIKNYVDNVQRMFAEGR